MKMNSKPNALQNTDHFWENNFAPMSNLCDSSKEKLEERGGERGKKKGRGWDKSKKWERTLKTNFMPSLENT